MYKRLREKSRAWRSPSRGKRVGSHGKKKGADGVAGGRLSSARVSAPRVCVWERDSK